MSAESNYYIGYKECGCPVAAVNADVATPHELAVSLSQMVMEGYTVKKSIGLPHAFLHETCAHGSQQSFAGCAPSPSESPDPVEWR